MNLLAPLTRVLTRSSDEPRTAIIDIGSNSIRLVVYQGSPRLPAVLFNEKVLAGLGRGLATTGTIAPEGMALARTTLSRFARLAREMEVTRLRTVATAAVRDAANGPELIAHAEAAGLSVELLSGEQEALAAGYGVLSAFPEADGIVGDLGGGSLELVRVRKGKPGDRVSFPLGVLRLAAIRAKGDDALNKQVARAIDKAGWTGKGKGLPLYLVGGSWRALARLDMGLTGYPLPIIHGYCMSAERIEGLTGTIAQASRSQLRATPGLSAGRVSTLSDAAAILTLLLRHLGSISTIVSAYGLREGLLFQELDAPTRAEDPLTVATRDEGRRAGRFPEHGDLLDRWLAPLFDRDQPDAARIRNAACQLADVGWRANPDFRAELGFEVALHGNWVGVDATGRAQMAQTLHASLGGNGIPAPLLALAPREKLDRAIAWGLAIRLGQRLSGGLAGPLRRSRLSSDEDTITLHLAPEDRALYGEMVERRHSALATFLNRSAVLGV
ncbi:Ppx/GppA family phosphatase [Sphingomonas sp.]|jgi:exopolyphosphatase/guanosine-5'-triphosphate,3'-diphosphate pyrophosphatase|uniref:Ppx/GppA family phosphatase n=1 Tax=Sphingomonas sp. TaxID=28214 RepID=UPI002D802A9C|nr:Ppx/GppA family phosphatase [Sphingomonas sp.]HEU0044739.1 Ppx/GppA family phosphatase [Sphingomonas sp.]